MSGSGPLSVKYDYANRVNFFYLSNLYRCSNVQVTELLPRNITCSAKFFQMLFGRSNNIKPDKGNRMKKKHVNYLLAGTATLYCGIHQLASASFYVIAASKKPSAFCTGIGVVEAAGQYWMDKNLGASQVATSPTDEAAYGDLYQWGRLGDGHQNRNSTPTATLSENDVPGHNKYIISSDMSPFNHWRYPINKNLWQGLGGVNNPCPQGFRLPTSAEWETELNSWISKDAVGAFISPLKLTTAGRRFGFCSMEAEDDCLHFSGVGEEGYYWSSTLSAVDDFMQLGSNRLFFNAGSANFGRTVGSHLGLSVRCIKE